MIFNSFKKKKKTCFLNKNLNVAKTFFENKFLDTKFWDFCNKMRKHLKKNAFLGKPPFFFGKKRGFFFFLKKPFLKKERLFF